MNRYCLLLFFIILPIAESFSQEPTQEDFDSVWAMDIALSDQLLKIDSMAAIMDAYFTDLPKTQIQKAYKIATENELDDVLPFLQLTLGSIYTSLDQIDSAQVYLELAQKGFETTNFKKKIALTHQKLSWVYLLIPYFDKSLEHGLLSLSTYEDLGDSRNAAYMSSEVGFVHLITENFDASLPFLEEAFEYFKNAGDPENLGYLYERFQIYHMGKGDTLSALDASSKAILEMDKLEDKSFLSGVLIARGLLHKEIGEFEKAEQDFLEAKVYAVASGYLLNDIEADRELGRLYVLTGEYADAIPVLEGIIRQYKESGNDIIGDYIELYDALAKAYAGLDQYEQAFLYQSKQEELEDSIYTMESNRNMADMQTKYETEKKETLLAQRQQQLYFSIGLLALLILMAGILWWAYSGKKKQNVLLEKSNEEKAFLIKEIHHRVKNNLQVLSSLLSLQSDYIQDPNALDAVTEGRNRVQSMGLIHQKLYMGDELATVDMKEYIPDLTEHLLASFGMEKRVELVVQSEIPPLDVDTAIPLGLIINELVTNSLKYAFPNSQSGEIRVHLWINPQKELCLKLSDTGSGIAAEASNQESTSFGTDLIRILSKKLKGKISIDTSQGYSTLIQFRRYNKSLV